MTSSWQSTCEDCDPPKFSASLKRERNADALTNRSLLTRSTISQKTNYVQNARKLIWTRWTKRLSGSAEHLYVPSRFGILISCSISVAHLHLCLRQKPKDFAVYITLHSQTASFPPMPSFVYFLVTWVFWWPYRRLWRFTPAKPTLEKCIV